MTAIAIFQAATARGVGFYLVPAVAGSLMISRFSRAGALSAFVCSPATLAHELLHLVIGYLTFARPVRLTLWPRRTRDGLYVYGAVEFENLRWWNAAPACLAPLLGFPIAAAGAWWRTQSTSTVGGWDLLVWIALAQLMAGSWPSGTDWRLAGRSWPYAVVAAAGLFGYLTWR
ncbi:hypothetical protein [Burkholderia diffusa]|uniref:hypothetical protein n=1 Tax=Burkholderia diffusa TaxID=488732 RepID=UPI001FC89950|nr:hypothetical protein [Burkholderia diffusa]